MIFLQNIDEISSIINAYLNAKRTFHENFSPIFTKEKLKTSPLKGLETCKIRLRKVHILNKLKYEISIVKVVGLFFDTNLRLYFFRDQKNPLASFLILTKEKGVSVNHNLNERCQ